MSCFHKTINKKVMNNHSNTKTMSSFVVTNSSSPLRGLAG